LSKCPLSGIDCKECGYEGLLSECFLHDLIEQIEKITKKE
jgi:hypothetical protein